jgi:hypothetical protein
MAERERTGGDFRNDGIRRERKCAERLRCGESANSKLCHCCGKCEFHERSSGERKCINNSQPGILPERYRRQSALRKCGNPDFIQPRIGGDLQYLQSFALRRRLRINPLNSRWDHQTPHTRTAERLGTNHIHTVTNRHIEYKLNPREASHSNFRLHNYTAIRRNAPNNVRTIH